MGALMSGTGRLIAAASSRFSRVKAFVHQLASDAVSRVQRWRREAGDSNCTSDVELYMVSSFWSDVVAFRNRNPVLRAHLELPKCAHRGVADSALLVNPTCRPTQPGDIDGVVRIETYEALRQGTERDYPMFRWAYLPYSMKMAGPREAIHHRIIRKNFGAAHFIFGRDIAGTKGPITGDDFYGAYDAQETCE